MLRELTFPSFVRASRASRRSNRRTTERGRLIQMGAVICAALGIDTDLTLIYQLFALLLCLIVISRLALSIRGVHVSVKRRLPRYATAGEAFEYYVEVANLGERVEPDLRLMDNPKVKSPTLEQFRRQREPEEETRNAYDRWLGFHRFLWLQRLNTGIAISQAEVADIPVKSAVRVKVEARPLRRGIVNLESISILRRDPLGLHYGITDFESPEELLVLPRRYPVSSRFELPGGRHFQPGGINAAWSIGESEEFVSLRDYRDGDSMRKIHWPSTARRTKPVVREYQEEYFVRQALVLDSSSEDEQVLEEAVSVAASFALKMSATDAMLDLLYLSGKAEMITSGRGRSSDTRQLEVLAGLKRTELPIEDLRDAVLRHAPLLSGCIVVLTGWCEVRRTLIERLGSHGVPLAVFLVSHEAAIPNLPAFVRLLEPGKIGETLAAL